ncbi:MAG TPA: 3-deoxy-8-phosphooctulonate synthase [Thermoanaerobaculia bacterium]|nr:3-deoxy-8-phosphooctulonate synthase [Thermoanaerobaculia bacterium]
MALTGRTVEPVELAPGVVVGGGGGDGADAAGALPVIAGPCVVESEELVLAAARTLAAMASRLALPLVFKSSFDKANRSALGSFRGPGLVRGLAALAAVKAATGLPVLTDVHEPGQCEPAAAVCDVLQIPAFLCRQTDLVLAAAATGRAVNIKKGQFMAPGDMRKLVDKARAGGNRRVTVTERGSSFGYHDLVVDMRSFAQLHDDGIAVIYDVTHSLQRPGGGPGNPESAESGGERRYALPLALAAVAAGADGLFLEVHPDPPRALSDRAVQLTPAASETLLRAAAALRRALLATREQVPA